MHPRQFIVDIVFGEHDLADLSEIFRFMLLEPENFGGGEACKGNVRGVLGKGFFADHRVQVVGFLVGAPVVPKDGGADDPILFVQNYQAVHLSAHPDALDGSGIDALGQFFYARKKGLPPFLGILLTPTRLGEQHGIGAGDLLGDPALAVHQQEL